MQDVHLPDLREQEPLQPLNTLALPATARYFVRVERCEQLPAVQRWAVARDLPLLVLGGGSNVVLAGDWPGVVLQVGFRGRRVTADPDAADSVLLEVAAGENWHELVQWTLRQGLYGLENLTLIPGTVGAAPIQNIGAYGVELSDRLVSVRFWSWADGRERIMTVAECELGYRDSIFKHALRDAGVITAITLRLGRTSCPVVTYPVLRDALTAEQARDARAVEHAIQVIRQSKLPDPAHLPNAGSFFKNAVIPAAQFHELSRHWPGIPGYVGTDAAGNPTVKVPAAWLVEKAGWKGRRVGGIAVHDRQALVLVHHGGGSGRALLDMAAAIQSDVEQQFGIVLELEPRVYGSFAS